MMIVKKSKRVAVLFVLGLLICLFYLVSDTIITDAKAAPPEDPMEHVGNCLSYPVINANGSMALRGTFGETTFEGEFDKEFTCGHDPTDPEHDVDICPYNPWYLQQDPDNEWRAQSNSPGGSVNVDLIDWSDSLEARPWTTNSIVRVETVLYINSDPMTAYEMRHISGLGMDEMWGTNGATYSESLPTVYASDAQITVQYLGDVIPEVLTWDSGIRTWIPVIADAVVMNEPYSAEVNIQGKVINGCSWNVRTDRYGTGEGYYRITMSFESTNTIFDAETEIMVTTEASSDGGEPQGGVAAVDVDNNLTYIDVLIESGKGSGGGGGQGPPSGGSSKGGGSH